MKKPSKIFLVRFRDSKYREEGISVIFYEEADAEQKAEKLNKEDIYGYIYYVEEMGIEWITLVLVIIQNQV